MATDTQDFEYSGFGISVSFSVDTDLKLYCKSVTPPGFDAGEDIDITTNETYGAMEMAPADLGQPTDMTLTVAENLEDRAKLQAALGKHQAVTLTFKKTKNRAVGRTLTFADAWIRSWTPSDHTIGEQPTVEVVIGIAGGSHTEPGGTASEDYNPSGTLSDVGA